MGRASVLSNVPDSHAMIKIESSLQVNHEKEEIIGNGRCCAIDSGSRDIVT